jgi:hypothetical protein
MTEPSPNTTHDQQQDAAVAAVNALPPEATPAVTARVIGNTSNTDQQRQDAAVAAVNALPQEATPAVMARVIGNMSNTDQQQQAATAAVNALPPEATPAVMARVIVNMSNTDQQQQAATAAVNALSPAGQQQVLSSVLGTPDAKTQRTLWYVVISTVSGAIFVFGVLTVVLIILGKNAEGALALATTALGGIVGLIATSPGARS